MPFSLSIKVSDYNEQNYENQKSYFISLDLNSVSDSSGNVTTGEWSKSIKPPYKFTNLSILSSGLFKINASAKNLTGMFSQEFRISNLVKLAKFSSNNDYFVYQNFSIKIDLIGEDNNPYILDTEVEINIIQDIFWFQRFKKYSHGQDLTFEGFSKKNGEIQFNVTTSNNALGFVSNQFKLNFLNAKIKLSFDKVVNFI